MGEGLAVIVMLAYIFAAIAGIMYLFLPFAIFGFQKKMEQQSAAIKKLTQSLEAIEKATVAMAEQEVQGFQAEKPKEKPQDVIY